jgi:hypothetical protein
MRVVQKGVRVMTEADVMQALHLPPGTVPPGAASNPDFLLSVMDPHASASRLEALSDVPKEIVEEVPEGEVVEMPLMKTLLAVGEGEEHGAHHILEHAVHAGEAGEESMKVLRVGGTLFKVVNYAYSGYRVVTAPSAEEAEKVAREEAGRIGGGWAGATGGVEMCVVIGVATEGVGFLVCGIVGAFVGEAAGEKLAETPIGWAFGKLGEIVWNIVHAPQLIAEGFRQIGEGLVTFLEVSQKIGELPGQIIGGSLVFAHEQLDPGNWDLRYLPAGMQADVMAAGNAVWAKLQPLSPDDFLTQLGQPLSWFGVGADVAARIAAVTSSGQQGQPAASPSGPAAAPSGAPGALTAGDLLAMAPVDFVRHLEHLRLTFVQNPEWAAGFGGRWDEPMLLQIHLGPLIGKRAAANPANWDVSKIPAVGLEAGRDIDLGDAITSVGATAWARLGPLAEAELAAEIDKPLAEFGLNRALVEDIAAGIEGLPHPALPFGATFGMEADTLLQVSPADLVETLRSWAVQIDFKTQPGLVVKDALLWVQAGFQPW